MIVVLPTRKRWGMRGLGVAATPTAPDPSSLIQNGVVVPYSGAFPSSYASPADFAAWSAIMNAGQPQGYSGGWLGGLYAGCPTPCAPPGAGGGSGPGTVLQQLVNNNGTKVTNPHSGKTCSCPTPAQLAAWGMPVPGGYPLSLFTSAPGSPATATPAACGNADFCDGVLHACGSGYGVGSSGRYVCGGRGGGNDGDTWLGLVARGGGRSICFSEGILSERRWQQCSRT